MPSQKVLNVAVIGCGEVAQCVHIPNLLMDHDRWKITALCDLSPHSLQYCGVRSGVPPERHFTAVPDMLSSATPIDVVFVLTADQYHAEHVIACADAGKHVMIEKPMAQTEAEADGIEAARQRNGVVIFVGYMRRYATALLRMKEVLDGKEIKYVRVRDIIGRNAYFTAQAGMHLKYFTDFPASSQSDRTARIAANLKENLPNATDDPRNAASMAVLGSLASHDLSAMRDLIGMPERCIAATRAEGEGVWWTALFKYQGFKAYFEMIIDEVAIFDAHIEVYTKNERIKIQYDTPYVKGLPIKLTIQTELPTGDFSEQIIRPTYEDPYVLELKELYAAIVDAKPYKTTPVDAKNDILLAKMIMGALVD
ncbi:hypothetical protein JCM24511_05699 [Saitozyma sp. JCM 24511]|nr:hypothetical protein JCM24511_05699 [Saitozyma sp. JCM 24511]